MSLASKVQRKDQRKSKGSRRMENAKYKGKSCSKDWSKAAKKEPSKRHRGSGKHGGQKVMGI